MNINEDNLSRLVSFWAVLWLIGGLYGCTSWTETTQQRQVASVLSYLFPGTESVPEVGNNIAEIKVPFRIGIAFVPDSTTSEFRLSESDRIKLSGMVRESFYSYPFVKEIVTVPSLYLTPGGGFSDLDRVAALLKLDVVALISFDQVQNSGGTGWSFLYWTGIGAYIVDGDEFDILTSVETTVFDINSRRLLMRAGGVSKVEDSSTWVGFSEGTRKSRTIGFNQAIEQMNTELHAAVKSFRQTAVKDPMIKLLLPEGYDPNAKGENQ